MMSAAVGDGLADADELGVRVALMEMVGVSDLLVLADAPVDILLVGDGVTDLETDGDTDAVGVSDGWMNTKRTASTELLAVTPPTVPPGCVITTDSEPSALNSNVPSNSKLVSPPNCWLMLTVVAPPA
jgi:hypothetical protein